MAFIHIGFRGNCSLVAVVTPTMFRAIRTKSPTEVKRAIASKDMEIILEVPPESISNSLAEKTEKIPHMVDRAFAFLAFSF